MICGTLFVILLSKKSTHLILAPTYRFSLLDLPTSTLFIVVTPLLVYSTHLPFIERLWHTHSCI